MEEPTHVLIKHSLNSSQVGNKEVKKKRRGKGERRCRTEVNVCTTICITTVCLKTQRRVKFIKRFR